MKHNSTFSFKKSFSRIIQVILFRLDTDLCFLRASSLTFYSILSVVPVLAVVFGIAKGFGIESVVEQTLRGEFKDQEEVIQYLIHFGYTLLEQTQGGLVAGIGVLTLFYTVLNLFSTIESSLNYTWGLKAGRPISRKISDYLALILICPIFFATASSLTVFITAQVEAVDTYISWLGQFRPLLQKTLLLLPYIVSTFLFTFLYMFIPNVRVRFLSALIAGLTAGIAYQILHASYISIQIVVSKTGAIYGSFAALPLFMLWLYFSWMIFLIGAEIVVIHQERLWDPNILAPYRVLSQFEKDLACLAITKMAIDGFLNGSIRVSPEVIAKNLQMPFRLVTELIEELDTSGIIVKTHSEQDKSVSIVLAQNPDELRVYDIVSAVHGEHLFEGGSEYPLLDAFAHLLQSSKENHFKHEYNPLVKTISV